MSNAQKILELLKIDTQNKTAEKIVQNMINNFDDKQVYCQNEAILLNGILGLDSVQSKLTESEVQNLHDKIHYMIECSQKKSASKSLYEQYFQMGQASKGIKKISKNNFKWNSLSENIMPSYDLPDVSRDKKQKIETYDSMTGLYKGKSVTPVLVMDLLSKGIILVPSHNDKSQNHISR